MLFREMNAVYSDNHTELINTLCGQNAESLTAEVGSTYKLPLSFEELG
jgi:hypothetical protein